MIELQKKLWKWQCRNFDNVNSLDLALGVIEETGEMAHAFLKYRQGIRGHDRKTFEKNLKDAIADTAIFFLNYLSALDKQYSYNIEKLSADMNILWEADNNDLGKMFSGLMESISLAIKSELMAGPIQHNIWHILGIISKMHGWNFEQTVKETAEEVMKRDWKKYPLTGRRPEDV